MSCKLWTLLLVISLNGFCQVSFEEYYNGNKILIGEDLTYVVKYAFFRLGEVRIKVTEKTEIENVIVYKTVAYIDSYPDLPFVSIHQVYESYIDSSYFPLKFHANLISDDTTFVRYSFIKDSLIEMQKGKLNSTQLWLDSTQVVDKRLQDGLSILFYARMNFRKDKKIYVPCFVNEKEEYAKMNYFDKNEPIEIDALDYEIDCLRLNGETDFVSVYGLTGYFEGWFSNDTFSVPIIAKMQVMIGSVTLELIKWNEELWNPPHYVN